MCLEWPADSVSSFSWWRCSHPQFHTGTFSSFAPVGQDRNRRLPTFAHAPCMRPVATYATTRPHRNVLYRLTCTHLLRLSMHPCSSTTPSQTHSVTRPPCASGSMEATASRFVSLLAFCLLGRSLALDLDPHSPNVVVPVLVGRIAVF